MKILGISAFYHDAAAAITEDGTILAAAQEERFTRKKHDPSFPVNAIKFCLEETGLSLEELDAIAFYDKPLLKFERLLETYYNFAPKGLYSFIKAIPVWVKEKLLLKKLIRDGLKDIEPEAAIKKVPLLFPEHHLSHAASAFYTSPFTESAILTIDGVGEWATATIGYGKGREIKIIKELHFPHSLGLLYSAVTYFLGFKVNSGEYKLMGLAPYGDPESGQVREFISIIESKLVNLKSDGSIWLNQDYFSYATGLRMIPDKKWEKLFGFPKRLPESRLLAHHCNLALAIQTVTEKAVLRLAGEAQQITGSRYLCLAGGVALNCVANGKVLRKKIFEGIFIQPAAGDAGGALGAALAAHHIYFGKERALPKEFDAMSGAFLGPEFSDLEILRVAKKYKAKWDKAKDEDDLVKKVAEFIAEGKVIGWFQGKMEFGPRALGNRSILGDPRNPDTQRKMNLKIKFRESFRPFAPAVIAKDASTFFELPDKSPYMLLVSKVLESRRLPVPDNYASLTLKEKLDFQKSDIPAVTHVDFSARIQTVHRETNALFYKLIEAFKAITGYGMLVNTSFNVRGEPIVCTPEDAFRCFLRTQMDYLVMGHFLFAKEEQELALSKTAANEEFVLVNKYIWNF